MLAGQSLIQRWNKPLYYRLVFALYGGLLLEFKPAYSVGDLLTQHLDELEQEAERKGGVLHTLSDHFAKVYKAPVDTVVAA